MYRADGLEILLGLKIHRIVLPEGVSWKYKKQETGMLEVEVLLIGSRRMRLSSPCMLYLTD